MHSLSPFAFPPSPYFKSDRKISLDSSRNLNASPFPFRLSPFALLQERQENLFGLFQELFNATPFPFPLSPFPLHPPQGQHRTLLGGRKHDRGAGFEDAGESFEFVGDQAF